MPYLLGAECIASAKLALVCLLVSRVVILHLLHHTHLRVSQKG